MQRNRTLTGCGTCRSRHVKCDEARPVCQNCQHQNLPCPGYERQLNWVREDTDADADVYYDSSSADRVFRRPLFSGKLFSLQMRCVNLILIDC